MKTEEAKLLFISLLLLLNDINKINDIKAMAAREFRVWSGILY